MKLYDVKQNGAQLSIRRTRLGHVVEAATRFGIWFPFVLAAEMVFFLPDYLQQYRHGAPDERLVFWGTLLGLAALIASLGAIVRFLRHDVWILDVDRDKLVFQTQPYVGRVTEAEVDLERVTGLQRAAQRSPRASRLNWILRGYPDETLCQTRWGASTLDEVVDAIREFSESRDLDLEVDDSSPAHDASIE